jgi:catechol 2,3-dioxygenase-like lactoylglutathione lyase family enzyme
MTLKTHLALNTVHFDDAVTFYRAFLGAEPVKLRGGYAKFDLDQPPLNLTLNQAPEGMTLNGPDGAGQINHLGVQVSSTEDVSAAAERLRSTGLVTLEERDTDCCYALQDKVWVADPDGNRWEVFVVKVADTGPEAVPEGTPACGCGPECCTEESAAA